MAVRKKHHYIPQFYLRRFSVDDDKKLIALYNHKNKLFVPSAQIRHQACEKYLYGTDDEIEEGLSKMENAVAFVMSLILDQGMPPPPDASDANGWLKKFILTQLSRTPQAGRELDESLNATFQAAFKSKDLHISHENPVVVSLIYSERYQPILSFLNCKILVNQTNIPFITSDHPVILYNQWMEKNGRHFGNTGLGVRGLQIFLPLHPSVMLCYYDPFVYKCGGRDNPIVPLEHDNDTHQLNVLQYLYSDSQLFAGQTTIKDYLNYLVDSSTVKRIENRSVVFSGGVNKKEGVDKEILMNTSKSPQINLELSCFSLKRKARKNAPPGLMPEIRHPSFKDLKFDN